MSIRTRFAPSPTGDLHVGGARTALYCYLFAKKYQGTFILRIEDTDLERSTKESVQVILDAMSWLKLDYDEGPFYQTRRMDRYREVIEILLSTDKAYKCYCSKERLETLRAEQLSQKEKPRYDGHCRNRTDVPSDSPYVVRFKNPETGTISFEDQIRGLLQFENSELDDLILARSDLSPTYNFTVVVDDWDMNITHVIRGDDHINNTPRQINILKALGAEPPVYAHVSMILGADGKRLSKRHGATNVMDYKAAGFLPEALLNYLVRLGWSHGDQEIFTRDEMVRYFDLTHITQSAAMFNPEKLLWLNQHYLKTLDPDYIAQQLKWHMEKLNVDISQGPALSQIVDIQKERCKTLLEMAEKSRYFYEEVKEYDANALQKNITPGTKNSLETFHKALEALPNWKAADIHACIQQTAETCEIGLGKIAQPVRIAITGNTISPPIDVTLALLGREKTLERIRNLIAIL